MEILIELTLLAAVLHCMTLQVWMVKHLRGEQPGKAALMEETPEELEARKLAAEAQARYEQGFINIMSYDGMPGREKEGAYR